MQGARMTQLNPETNDIQISSAIRIEYVPVSNTSLWAKNPKKHDIGAIISAIKEYGFRDPPAWDTALEAIVEGNGRIEALHQMMLNGEDVPKGIGVANDGVWHVPVVFGGDSDSLAQAERYAIDHNNLTMLGGDFSLHDLTRMWEPEAYAEILNETFQAHTPFISLELEDIQSVLSVADFFDSGNSDSDTGTDTLNDAQKRSIIKIYVDNDILLNDVTEEIQALLDENIGWGAMILE